MQLSQLFHNCFKLLPKKNPRMLFLHSRIFSSFWMRDKIIPLLYPRHCPVCHRILPYGSLICSTCRPLLPFVTGPICYSCGKPISNMQQEYCYDCRTFPKTFQSGRALFLYHPHTQPAMMAFKYQNRRMLSQFYAKEIVSRHSTLFQHWNLDAIIPVPIHKNKYKKRGYNQAELLARDLSALTHIPCLPHLLLRTIDTLPQKQFHPQARLNNLQKAFQIHPNYTSEQFHLKTVLLIDDIYTTGATMETCSRILHQAGIEKIYIYSVCIGLSRE